VLAAGRAEPDRSERAAGVERWVYEGRQVPGDDIDPGRVRRVDQSPNRCRSHDGASLAVVRRLQIERADVVRPQRGDDRVRPPPDLAREEVEPAAETAVDGERGGTVGRPCRRRRGDERECGDEHGDREPFHRGSLPSRTSIS